MEVVRCRGPAAGAVVKNGEVGAHVPGQSEEIGQVLFQGLGPMTAMGDGEMGDENGERVAQNQLVGPIPYSPLFRWQVV